MVLFLGKFQLLFQVLILILNKCFIVQTKSSCNEIFLTVSSSKNQFLELNWNHHACINTPQPNFIALYSKNPRNNSNPGSPLLKTKTVEFKAGKFITTIKFGDPWLPGGWEFNESTTDTIQPGSHCYPYWIASLNDDEILDTKCLSIHPTWMYDNRQYISNYSISKLFLPGTHNSGAVQGQWFSTFLSEYVLNQDRSVWIQLVHGIRYLDFRIGYYAKYGFTINHDVIKITDVKSVLKEVRKFVTMAPKEIVIVDFHRFPYPSRFTLELHEKFVALVNEYLGQYAIPRLNDAFAARHITVNDIWRQNKSLIISYHDSTTAYKHNWLWPPIIQYWGRTNNKSKLKKYIADTIREQKKIPHPLYTIMATLTPQPIDIILRINNLRKLADSISYNLTAWFRDDFTVGLNVVATDYFLSNDMINIAIDYNKNL